MLIRAEWESEVASLPYYFLSGEIPPAAELSPGIYLVRGVPEDLAPLGYTPLPSLITLESAFNVEQITRLGNHTPTIPIHRCHPKQIGNEWLAAGAADSIPFKDNRLYWTLPKAEATELMKRWVYNCFKGRCDRCGTHLDRFGKMDGFIGTRMLSSDTAVIDLVGVRPSERGQGIGTELVLWALAHCKAQVMVVRTEASNQAALKMYQRAGFQKVHEEKQWWVRVEG